MFYAILLIGIVGAYFGVPVVAALVVVAILQAATAYVITRNQGILLLLAAMAVLGGPMFLLPTFPTSSPELKAMVDTMVNAGPWLVGAASLLVLVYSTVVGIFNIRGPAKQAQ